MARELLFSVTKKDLDITHMRAGGPGGQHQNKTSSATRIVHKPSGAVAEAREHRSQPQNTKAAFKRLTETLAFKKWMAEQLLIGPTPEQWVASEMQNTEHFKVEGRGPEGWEEI